MNKIPGFPKIYHVDNPLVSHIFSEGVIEITEKIDGSQLSFGMIDGELHIRSKEQPLTLDNSDKLFREGIEYIYSINNKIPKDYIFHCEYLKNPRHNVLKYDRIPKNHLMVFSVFDIQQGLFIQPFPEFIEPLGLELVEGFTIYDFSSDFNLMKHDLSLELDKESILGGKREGIVIKNYELDKLLNGKTVRIVSAKLVSNEFKERHSGGKKNKIKKQDGWEVFKSSFRTDARWLKAIQHLRDRKELKNDKSDIGIIMKEIFIDIEEECKDQIIDFLYKYFGKELIKDSVKGFVGFYEDYLKERAITNE